MKHFTQNFIDFFSELEKNNNKEWFDINRKTYELEVKKPFYDFATNMILAISQFDNSVDKDPKKAIFRINRDIRFAKDKTPYNTDVRAAFVNGGRKSSFPGYYISIGSDKIHVGGGLYAIEKDNLESLRNYILDNQMEFYDLINDKEFKSVFGEIQGEKNKKLKPEFKAILNKNPLIANKQFYFMTEISSKDFLLNENLIKELIKMYKAGYSFNKFLSDAIA